MLKEISDGWKMGEAGDYLVIPSKHSERFAQSPDGAPKGALFLVFCVPPDISSLPPCSRPSRGFRGINGCPPRTAGECRASQSSPRLRRARVPPFIPRPLDRRCAWRCSEGVGTGNVSGRDGSPRPCGGVEQGTWLGEEAERLKDQAMASSPFERTRVSSFSEGPLGRFAPRSQSLTNFVPTLI